MAEVNRFEVTSMPGVRFVLSEEYDKVEAARERVAAETQELGMLAAEAQQRAERAEAHRDQLLRGAMDRCGESCSTGWRVRMTDEPGAAQMAQWMAEWQAHSQGRIDAAYQQGRDALQAELAQVRADYDRVVEELKATKEYANEGWSWLNDALVTFGHLRAALAALGEEGSEAQKPPQPPPPPPPGVGIPETQGGTPMPLRPSPMQTETKGGAKRPCKHDWAPSGIAMHRCTKCGERVRDPGKGGN